MNDKAMIEKLFSNFCQVHKLSITLSFQMPPGYEEAFGTFDVLTATLHLNMKILQSVPAYEGRYHMYHELRHALQYSRPMEFSPSIRRSLPYVVLYNGVCFKLLGEAWQQVKLEGEKDYFTRAYQNLPYEIDANQFALAEALADFPENALQIQQLADFYLPKSDFTQAEYQALFDRINAAANR